MHWLAKILRISKMGEDERYTTPVVQRSTIMHSLQSGKGWKTTWHILQPLPDYNECMILLLCITGVVYLSSSLTFDIFNIYANQCVNDQMTLYKKLADVFQQSSEVIH